MKWLVTRSPWEETSINLTKVSEQVYSHDCIHFSYTQVEVGCQGKHVIDFLGLVSESRLNPNLYNCINFSYAQIEHSNDILGSVSQSNPNLNSLYFIHFIYTQVEVRCQGKQSFDIIGSVSHTWLNSNSHDFINFSYNQVEVGCLLLVPSQA